jgi:transcriptional regulator with XRE-family HTH domain
MSKPQPHAYGRALGKRLRRSRQMRGFTQMELAALSGVPQPQISKLESGGTDDPGVKSIRNLALVLGVTVDYLLGLYIENPETYLCDWPYLASATDISELR